MEAPGAGPAAAGRVHWIQVALSLAIALVAVAYTAGVVAGVLPESRQINATHLAVLVAAAGAILLLLRPRALDRLTRVDVAGVKLELDRQADRIDEISRILPLLLPSTERSHLLKLAGGTTKGYVGGHPLRTELRRLRSIGLLQMRGSHRVGEMADGASFDLAEYVALTAEGRWWAEKSRALLEADQG